MNHLALNSINCNRSIFLLNQNTKNILVNGIRNISGCFEDKAKCPKGKIVNTTCEDNKHELPPRKVPKKEEFKSMWESPKCEPTAATCPQVRFDALYYKPSDKEKRQYQQTWIECPAQLIKPTVICEYPKGKYPPLERRPRSARPDTAKCMDSSKLELGSCSRQKDLKQNKNCLKIALPGCRGVRSDIRCKLVREPANCIIAPCPYPSFSECTRPKSKPKRSAECECLKIRSMCEVWTILRQKTIL